VKKILIILILLFTFLAPTPVYATVGPFVNEVTVFVDGKAFTLWGIADDTAISSIRLRDLAYVLNGTSAQFDIRETTKNDFDYWIVRGAPYTPIGNELQPITSYYDDGWDNKWFIGSMTRTIIGIDGTDEPETFIDFTAYIDDYDLYFPLRRLATLLGFSLEWSRVGYIAHGLHEYYIEGADYVLNTKTGSPAEIPIQSVEFLDLMWQLHEHWVDSAHFYSDIIDESVVWPMELFIAPAGYGVRFTSWRSVAPMNPPGTSYFWQYWYPLQMRHLADGVAELIISNDATRTWHDIQTDYASSNSMNSESDFYKRRILVDTSQDEIEEIFLYINDTRYHMVRPYSPPRDARRYSVSINEEGYIVLRYVLGQNAFWPGDGIAFIRSTLHNPVSEFVEFVFYEDSVDYNNRVLFEFIDTTARPGNVYYYSIQRMMSWGAMALYANPDYSQIRVDVNALLMLNKIEIQEDEDYTEYIAATIETSNGLPWLFFAAGGVIAVALVGAALCRPRMSGKYKS